MPRPPLLPCTHCNATSDGTSPFECEHQFHAPCLVHALFQTNQQQARCPVCAALPIISLHCDIQRSAQPRLRATLKQWNHQKVQHQKQLQQQIVSAHEQVQQATKENTDLVHTLSAVEKQTATLQSVQTDLQSSVQLARQQPVDRTHCGVQLQRLNVLQEELASIQQACTDKQAEYSQQFQQTMACSAEVQHLERRLSGLQEWHACEEEARKVLASQVAQQRERVTYLRGCAPKGPRRIRQFAQQPAGCCLVCGFEQVRKENSFLSICHACEDYFCRVRTPTVPSSIPDDLSASDHSRLRQLGIL